MSSVNNQLTALFESNEYIGHRKIIISSAGTSKRNNLKQYLRSSDVLYAEVLPNPSLNQLIDFFRIIQLTEKDLVFGIGGGSVIDFAKLVALFAETSSADIKGIIESGRFGLIREALKLVIVPTLFGSGAEQTPFAVCYIDKKKYSVANDLILPASVAYIPEINTSATAKIKLANVLDCFCQAAESLTARNANKASAEYAERTLRLLVPIAREYIEESSIELSAKMAEASNLCGKAIAISKTTGPHAMSYYLTSVLKWSHGEAVAFTFVYFLEKYRLYRSKDDSIQRLFQLLNEILPDKTTESFFRSIGLELSSRALEVIESVDFTTWINSVNLERLTNGPKVDMTWLTENEMKDFYKSLCK